MNSLDDPIVSELLERLHTEATAAFFSMSSEGALVIADNVDDGDHPYPIWVRDPARGFVSSSITLKGGTEYSIWTGTSAQEVTTP